MAELNEIVIISGKGGTGKTTLALSIAPYLETAVFADCDVDAPDLDIILSRKKIEKKIFYGSKKAVINHDKCIECSQCYIHCKFDAVKKNLEVNTSKCEGCGVCQILCPVDVIEMKDVGNGELYTSETDYGKLFHARLNPGEENSGKLVAEVRIKAREYAKANNIRNILVDGAPGIACNVISSITGSNKVIIVTEPTVSGFHDLERVLEVTKKFRLKTFLVINRYSISEEYTEKTEKFAKINGIETVFKIPFDKKIIEAISNKKIPSIDKKEIFENAGFFEFVKILKNS